MTEQTPFPDLEIYIKQVSLDAVMAWLNTLGNVQPHPDKSSNGNRHELLVDNMDVMVLESAAGKKFTSIWFQQNDTPWTTDIDCAKAANQHFNLEIRCSSAGWKNGDAMDEWWYIDRDGEGLINWEA
jgi:hypothetical protein